jgi:hypothetical protein
MGVGVILLVALGVGLGLADSLGSRGRDRRPDATPNAATDQSGSFDPGRIPGGTLNAATDDRDLREVVEGLRESLEEQIRRHEELRAEVALMRVGMSGAASEVQDEEDADRKETPYANGWQAAGPAEGFDDGRLLQAGLHPSDAERLRAAWERVTLEEMALKDAARREGWYGKKRYRDELTTVRSGLREELGENGFDALLFATGQANRILVTDVIARSSAAYAGFQEGDQILRYDGRRVFTPRELEKVAASGVSGSTVAVEVMRQGRSETLSVRRGPLGVVTSIVRSPPVGG